MARFESRRITKKLSGFMMLPKRTKGMRYSMNSRILTTLAAILFLMNPAIPDDFTEDEIESEEALANSDAAIAEKNELKNLRENEKRRAQEEKAQAARAKEQAALVQKQAIKENEQLMRDVKYWQRQRKGFENERKNSEKMESDQRHQIEKIKIERDKEQAIFDQSKKDKDDAKAAYKASVELYKSLKADLEKMRTDRQKLAQVTKEIQAKTGDVNKRNEVLEKRMLAGTKIRTVTPPPVRSVANYANSPIEKRKITKLGEQRRLKQDCNLRLGPSTKAEVYKILRKGEPVLFHKMEGIWFAVSTKEVQKAYLSKPCL
ncbi:MAG: hypothetical protein A4S09_02830 [Proteobacteria bacterium SG_bin7]|nr:MAG: hypothetical protein A4S09_02830 [Proteobacteria bacterium SG_bin7]